MKLLLSLIFSLLLVSPAHAKRDGGSGRSTGASVGFGVGRSSVEINGTDSKSRFDGWTPAAEIGFDWAWSEKIGMLIGLGYSLTDLINSSERTTFIESAKGTASQIKAGFFIGNLGLGGGISKEAITIRQVSTGAASTESKINGSTRMLFMSFNLPIDDSYRLTFEAKHKDGELDAYKFTELSGSMSFHFLF